MWANSPLSDDYTSLWTTDVSVRAGDAVLSMDLRHWVNDGLMFLFFLVVGIEVRRELAMGELTDRRTITVPALAAVGGMVVPAAIYFAVGGGDQAPHAWGVVIATDTAFLLGALALVGASQSTPLRVFLLTLTIFDDVAAVTVIAVFYSEAIDGLALILAAACVLAVVALGRRQGLARGAVRRRRPRALAGDARVRRPSRDRRHGDGARDLRLPARSRGGPARRRARRRLPPVADGVARPLGAARSGPGAVPERAHPDGAAPVDQLRRRAAVRARQRAASTCAATCSPPPSRRR